MWSVRQLIRNTPVPHKKTYKLIWADDAELNSLDRAQWACAVAGGRSVHPVYSKRRVLRRHAALWAGTAFKLSPRLWSGRQRWPESLRRRYPWDLCGRSPLQPNILMFWSYVRRPPTVTLPFSDLHSGALWALLSVRWANGWLYRLSACYGVTNPKSQGPTLWKVGHGSL